MAVDQQRLRQIFLSALETPRAEREAFLDRACAGDVELRREVESLLDATLERVRFLESPALEVVEVDLAAGTRVNDLVIERELGRGGMGAVYLARDSRNQRLVALKLIRQGRDAGREAIERFKSEARTLGQLVHPHIATLYDSGLDPALALHYLALEFVDGLPIDDYCERERLGLEDRLRLFVKICQAVQFAHQNMIVHRDLKPSNILVEADGQPKLLDFGIAKLLDPDTLLPIQETRSQAMSLPYASPEQLLSKPVSAASDGYSLGVLLFKLLVGTSPYGDARRNTESLRRAILEAEPETASRAAARRSEIHWASKLRGDLDTIVRKALRKDPGERYNSVQQLADDVRRYLNRIPITAARRTALYTAKRFLQRHWTWALPLAGFAVAVLLAAGIIVWQSRENARQRDLAQREAARAQKQSLTAENTTQFLIDLFKVTDSPEPLGRSITAKEVLDRGADKLSESLASEPEVRARLLGVIGVIYVNLGVYDRGAELLEEALQEKRTLLLPDDPDLIRGIMDLAHQRLSANRLAEAEVLAREAEELSRQLPERHQAQRAECLDMLGWILLQVTKVEESESLLKQGLELRRRVLGPRHPDVAKSLHNLGVVYQNTGRIEEALPLLRDALEIQQEAFGESHVELAMTLHNLAMAATMGGRTEAAESLLRRSLRIHRTISPEHRNVTMNLHSLALLLLRKGQSEEAEQMMREALGISEKTLGPDNLDTAGTLHGLGVILEHRGKYAEAERLARRGLAIANSYFPGDSFPVALMESLLGGCLAASGRREEAEELLKRSHPVIVKARGENAPSALDSSRRLELLTDGP